MKIKNVFALLLMFALCMSTVMGCGKVENSVNSTEESEVTSSEEEVSTEAEDEEKETEEKESEEESEATETEKESTKEASKSSDSPVVLSGKKESESQNETETKKEENKTETKIQETIETQTETPTKETEVGHEHVLGEWKITKKPTCEDGGTEVRQCECGYTENRNIASIGHFFGDWVTTKEATATSMGEETRKCSTCGKTEEHETEKLSVNPANCNHNYTESRTVTPWVQFYNRVDIVYTCSICGRSYSEQKNELTNCDYGAAAYELISYVNSERIAAGKNELAVHPVLMDRAVQRAYNGNYYFNTVNNAHYDWCAVLGDIFTAGECAATTTSASDAYNAFKNSPPHHSIYMMDEAKYIGVGFYGDPSSSTYVYLIVGADL